MKKLLMIFLCAALALSLCACTMIGGFIRDAVNNTPPAQTDAAVQLPNPMEPVGDASAFAALGITMDAPEGAQDVSYYIINKTLAQVSFTLDGFAYTYRASAVQSDISGVYDTFTEAFVTGVQVGDAPFDVTVRNAAAGGRLAEWSQSGVQYSLWCSLAPDDATIETCVLGVIAKTFGEVTVPTAMDSVPVDFTQEKTLDMDLNGDALLEHVTFEPAFDGDGYMVSMAVRIVSDDGSDVSVVTELVGDPSAALACDIDGDGLVELFISGDMCSSDYETWLLRYDGGAIIGADPCYMPDYAYDYLLPAAFGSVEGIENGIITVMDTVNILGSWWCDTQYQMTASGFGLERVPGSVWSYSYENYADWDWAATTAMNVPATLDGQSAPTTLPVGTKLIPMDTDGLTYLHFITEDGVMGTLYVTFDTDGWGYSINGVDEYDLFSNMPYAG